MRGASVYLNQKEIDLLRHALDILSSDYDQTPQDSESEIHQEIEKIRNKLSAAKGRGMNLAREES